MTAGLGRRLVGACTRRVIEGEKQKSALQFKERTLAQWDVPRVRSHPESLARGSIIVGSSELRRLVMHPNEALARREIDLIAAGDLEALEGLYSSDLIVHYPGRNPLSGTHPVQQFLAKFGALLGDGTLSRELHDALGTDDHAVQLLHVTASAGGRSHSWNAVAVLHVRDGKFSECWIHVDDQYALDEFLNSLVR
jgi:hypothetical protein